MAVATELADLVHSRGYVQSTYPASAFHRSANDCEFRVTRVACKARCGFERNADETHRETVRQFCNGRDFRRLPFVWPGKAGAQTSERDHRAASSLTCR